MNEILAIYHRPTVAREYGSAQDFAAQVISAEDTEGIDLDELERAACQFWLQCREDFAFVKASV